MHRRGSATLLPAAAAIAVALSGLTACGADESRTALAIEDARWLSDRRIQVDVECADVTDWALSNDDAGPPTVEVRGQPKVGRCTGRVAVAVPPGTTKIEDAATGQVIDLRGGP